MKPVVIGGANSPPLLNIQAQQKLSRRQKWDVHTLRMAYTQNCAENHGVALTPEFKGHKLSFSTSHCLTLDRRRPLRRGQVGHRYLTMGGQIQDRIERSKVIVY